MITLPGSPCVLVPASLLVPLLLCHSHAAENADMHLLLLRTTTRAKQCGIIQPAASILPNTTHHHNQTSVAVSSATPTIHISLV